MKKVQCAYKGCGDHRINFESDKKRPHQMVDVEDDFKGEAYCSFECAGYAGRFDVKNGWKKRPLKMGNES